MRDTALRGPSPRVKHELEQAAPALAGNGAGLLEWPLEEPGGAPDAGSPRLSGGHSLHETSTVLVETVTKSSSSRGSSYSSIPKFSSDASKVVTRGPGLSQAFVGQKNSFTVDCSKAGSPLPPSPGTNMMMVGVHGPKTPCEEVYVKHMGNRVYNVTYTVKEKGDYILIVKWGDESVPGSPFKVKRSFPAQRAHVDSCPHFLPLALLPAEPGPGPAPLPRLTSQPGLNSGVGNGLRAAIEGRP
ncbi:hypothetical protein P7K49_025620 [Saguinus oedipus]|uniref:Uncharacterized protein n=1 Tax=Saguinus oedipus TaxID=9490 RepID=A0ABQ9UHR7_SAGOE|nr:hypothetical protein P7K49_025620 [Saguinus oedipus]